MRRFACWAIGIVSVALVFGGCATPYAVSCMSLAQSADEEWKYTERQAGIVCNGEALFTAIPHLFVFDEKNEIWKLNPGGIPLSMVESVVDDITKTLDAFLSYDRRRWADFIDSLKGFREGLLKEERVNHYVASRLKYVKTYNEFVDLVGELPPDLKVAEEAYYFSAGRKNYTLRLLYPHPEHRLEAIPFTARYVENAKREGILLLVDSVRLETRQDLAKKVPNLYDANEFSWDAEKRGWKIDGYKVLPKGDKPRENVLQYLEVFRLRQDGTSEERAALRGFTSFGGTKLTVFVLDYDPEGTSGHGSPDEVYQYYLGAQTAQNFLTDSTLRGKLISLFERRQEALDKPQRRKPKERQVYTEIVRMGETTIEVWERAESADGWRVPFPYGTLTVSLDIRYAVAKTPEEKRLEELEKVKRIDFFKRDFKRSDANTVVVEYWQPKSVYHDRTIRSASASSDTLRIRRKDGPEENGEVGYFGERIEAIDYLYGGRWFRIIDEDGDGVFEKRRSIADPTSGTVSYSSSPY